MSMLGNVTGNQHFVSQAEQRLNASNPASTSKKFRIFSFRITDRKNHTIELESERGHLISSTMSMLDLFSFDVPEGTSLRLNLEHQFKKHEDNVGALTKRLLGKLSSRGNDIGDELVDLLAAKLLNFVRNPFCIEKVLNSFPDFAAYSPTDPDLLTTYQTIASGRKPHQDYVCRELGVSHETYIQWLKLLFMVLTPLKSGESTLFDNMIKRLIENRSTHNAAFVWIYDHAHCLLSDRGFCQPVESGPTMTGWSFNLCSTAYIDYVFADVAALMKGKTSAQYLEYLLEVRRKMPPSMNWTVTNNDLEALALYNRHVIQWSRERAYCAVKSDIVL